jgi:hypothetical protein
MLSSDWLEYMAGMERQIASRPELAPKKGRRVQGMTSPAQRRALQQTGNSVRAIYQEVGPQNGAQIRPQGRQVPFTADLGGNCEKTIPTGKKTQSRRR